MAMTPYTGDTSIIADLATYWSERGLTGPQMQAKFDEGLTNFVAWFNAAHLAELCGSLPNRNLLHNWYLKNVINHRGITTKSGSDYGIDRWMMNDAAGSITVAGGAVTNVSLSSAWAGWFQAVEDYAQYKGKTVTFSVFIESLTSGTAYARIFDGAATFDSDVPLSVGLNTVTATISAAADRLWCGIGTKLASPVSCCPSMCKLEPGRFSTLMNDPPADYGEELRKCQRYLELLPSPIYWITSFGNQYLVPLTANYKVVKRVATGFPNASCLDGTSISAIPLLDVAGSGTGLTISIYGRLTQYGIDSAVASAAGLTPGTVYKTAKSILISSDL